MSHRRLTFPAVAVLAIASLALGVVAALADGRDGGKRGAATVRATSPRAALAAPAPRPVLPGAAIAVDPAGGTFLRAAVPAAPCPADDKPPAAAPVPQNLLDAFGVLRRERADTDTLPASALKALRQRGLEPFDPAAARLLRQTDDGGRAWVVPVRDVSRKRRPPLRDALRGAHAEPPAPGARPGHAGAQQRQRARPGTRRPCRRRPDAPGARQPPPAGPRRPRPPTSPRPTPASPSSRSTARPAEPAAAWRTSSAAGSRLRSTPAAGPTTTCSRSPGSCPTASAQRS